ncbi:MAG: DNA repair protein RecN [Saprospiraceae bacterium]
MIKKLLIRNFALIDDLEILFSENLTIITGETGAGKSILLGGLGLIMGNRADGISFYNPAEKIVIEGYFDIKNYDIKSFFEENELDYDSEVVVRREIAPSGKSRAFINDTPVTLKELQQLSSALIDLHLQFDTLDIHQVSFQLRMIDALADNQKKLAEYQHLFLQYQSDKKKLSDLIQLSASSSKEMDFLNYQLEEFNKAELTENEQELLEAELQKLSNSEAIKNVMFSSYRQLYDDDSSISTQLDEIIKNIYSIKKYHKEVASIYERLENLRYELNDVAKETENIAADTEYDGERIIEIQGRLDMIYKLQKKHQVSDIKTLIEIETQIREKIHGFADLSGSIATLEEKITKQEIELKGIALELSSRRNSVTEVFVNKVESLLAQLAMEHAKLKVEVRPIESLTFTGSDDVAFLFAANLGSKFMPIKDTASGGELSRLTLCIKSLVASSIPLPTLIFDEIDAGVSGDVALKMGRILRQLSDKHQVVSITHSPQIAAQAKTHYFVYKKTLEDKTVTNVRSLNEEERIRAIATMLSTNPPTQSAIENAKELLAGV